MKTLVTALAFTAILATSAIAKTERTKHVRIQPNNVVSRNSVSHNPAARINASWCHFRHAEADPDPSVRWEVVRDCKEHEESESF
jgi:hypothetical protein